MRRVKKLGCRHEWLMRRGGRVVYIGCRKCCADLRMEMFETEAKYMVLATVISAGRGVSSDDIDYVCDWVHELVVEQRSPVRAA